MGKAYGRAWKKHPTKMAFNSGSSNFEKQKLKSTFCQGFINKQPKEKHRKNPGFTMFQPTEAARTPERVGPVRAVPFPYATLRAAMAKRSPAGKGQWGDVISGRANGHMELSINGKTPSHPFRTMGF